MAASITSVSLLAPVRQQPLTSCSGRAAAPAAIRTLLLPGRRQRQAAVHAAALGDSSQGEQGLLAGRQIVKQMNFSYMNPADAAAAEAAAEAAWQTGMQEYTDLQEWLLFRTWRFGLLFAGYLLLAASGEAAFCELIGTAAGYGYFKWLIADVDRYQPGDVIPVREADAIQQPLLRGAAKVAAAYRQALQPRLLVLPGLLAAAAAWNAAYPEDALGLVEQGCLVGGFLSWKVALVLKVYEDLKPKPLTQEDIVRQARPMLVEVEDAPALDLREISRRKAAEAAAAAAEQQTMAGQPQQQAAEQQQQPGSERPSKRGSRRNSMQRRKKKKEALNLGYKRGLEDAYELGKEIGRGGNGVVRLARHKPSGRSFAVKSIPKVLTDPAASERKRASQIPYLKREVEVLLVLRGTLNVANLEAVYEDDTHVHLVLEHCSGGELLSRTRGGRHYSERTAASFLRAVLRTVAQCHAKRIIHRDIKPENFLFLSDDEAAPLKAVDFGLAVFFDPKQLPITGLNPEGTPWYLAPECCRAKWHPHSDVWAVGVMACYLLTGAYPFLDRLSPDMPDLARTLRSICFEELDLGRKEFAGLSDPARAFITALLVKDPLQRPSAEEALRHPFLASSSKSEAVERAAGAPLGGSVVSRIQRFAQSSLFKRTVLEHIAADLLAMHFTPEPSVHGASVFRERSVRGGNALRAAERSVRGGSLFGGDRSMRGGSVRGGNGSVRAGNGSVHNGSVRNGSSVRGGGAFAGGTGDRSAHGGERFRGMTLAAMAAARFERSVRGGSAYFAGSREGSRHGGADRSVHSREASALSGEREGSSRGAPPGMHRVGSARLVSAGVLCADSAARSASQYLPVATPYSHRLAQLFDQLQLKPGQKLDRAALQKGLEQIGYHLAESEVSELFSVVDVQQRGEVGRAELAAGLIDWKAFEDTYKDRWVACARRIFAELDADGSGELSAAEIASAFSSHLAPYEVDAAVHQALLEATGAPQQSGGGTLAADGQVETDAADSTQAAAEPAAKLDFEHFMALLREPSGDIDGQLYKFDDRLSAHTSRQASLRGDELPVVEGRRCCTIM